MSDSDFLVFDQDDYKRFELSLSHDSEPATTDESADEVDSAGLDEAN
jgi:hypothetical protein